MTLPPKTSAATAAIRGSLYSGLEQKLPKGRVYPLHVGDTWL